ncbi:unnamed protein product [Prunus armeniaca]
MIYINPEISRFRRARPASFPGRFLPPPVIDSGKTGHVRTTTLPSSSPSPSQSRSAVVVAGNRHETGRFGQFLTEFRGARSPSSGHRFRRVSVDSSIYELGFNRFSGHCSGHFRPVFGDTHALSARVAAREQIGRDPIQFQNDPWVVMSA